MSQLSPARRPTDAGNGYAYARHERLERTRQSWCRGDEMCGLPRNREQFELRCSGSAKLGPCTEKYGMGWSESPRALPDDQRYEEDQKDSGRASSSQRRRQVGCLGVESWH